MYCVTATSALFLGSIVQPANAIGLNEMSFGRDICMVPSNIVLDRGPTPIPHGKEKLGVGPPFTATLHIGKLLWPLFVIVCCNNDDNGKPRTDTRSDRRCLPASHYSNIC